MFDYLLASILWNWCWCVDALAIVCLFHFDWNVNWDLEAGCSLTTAPGSNSSVGLILLQNNRQRIQNFTEREKSHALASEFLLQNNRQRIQNFTERCKTHPHRLEARSDVSWFGWKFGLLSYRRPLDLLISWEMWIDLKRRILLVPSEGVLADGAVRPRGARHRW